MQLGECRMSGVEGHDLHKNRVLELLVVQRASVSGHRDLAFWWSFAVGHVLSPWGLLAHGEGRRRGPARPLRPLRVPTSCPPRLAPAPLPPAVVTGAVRPIR